MNSSVDGTVSHWSVRIAVSGTSILIHIQVGVQCVGEYGISKYIYVYLQGGPKKRTVFESL